MKSGIYRSNRDFCRVMFVARNATSNHGGGMMVIYVSMTTGIIHTRDKDEFLKMWTLVNQDFHASGKDFH